ncbi:methylmalonyl-CoA mutase family protein [Chryseolinea sp. H1M3-3]|uniref:methylmalonyl-CoA mutase family protein n=1 Tax=Chryseolinea sp. H1M3-3 TaxID=3034144 RepID=UPI0023EBCF03|nr:methylmalonyl-CoA mutase family protein [Chryseolinea sp. H1M3-3]
MPEPSIHHILRESFSQGGKEEWLRTALQELTEKKTIDNLSWKVDGLNFYPYYDEEDLKSLGYLKNFQVKSHDSALEKNAWGSVSRVFVKDEDEANALALRNLTAGADGILFDVTGHEDFDIDVLLNKIHWPFCSLSFSTSNGAKLFSKLTSHARKKNYTLSALKGSIYHSTKVEVRTINFQALENYYALGIVIQPSSPTQEISQGLEKAALLMDSLTNQGMAKENVFSAISLSLTSDDNFFVTIAKLKAMRLLWYQLSQAFEISSYTPDKLHLHVTAEKWSSENFQPHGNILKNTAHALASILGGCNSLTLCPEDDLNDTLNRIGINVSNILKEECHLDKVFDPLAGAYVIENMVHQFSQSAWNDFQNKMRA